MFVVPMVRVPLNIMCSKRCEMPVMPGRSFTEPTFATQPAATLGSPLRGTISTFMPLSSTISWTATCCAVAASGHSATAATTARNRHALIMGLPSLCSSFVVAGPRRPGPS